MNINQYKQQAAHFRQLLQEQEDLRLQIADFEKDFKESANLTNPQVATTKRIIKADIKGKLPDLIVKMDDDQAILDILAPTEEKVCEEKVFDAPHDPETGEIIEQGRTLNQQGSDSEIAGGSPPQVSSTDAIAHRDDASSSQREDTPHEFIHPRLQAIVDDDMLDIPPAFRREA